MAQPFSATTLKTTGQAVPIADQVYSNAARAVGEFSISGGTLAYVKASVIGKEQLVLFDGEANKLTEVGTTLESDLSLSLSPDGRRVAASVTEASSNTSIWIYDTNGPGKRRLTFGPGQFGSPVWSPDGGRIAYSDTIGNIYVQSADGSSPARIIHGDTLFANVCSWFPDGTRLAISDQAKTGVDIHILSMDGQSDIPFLTSPAWENQAAFAPDGKWLAYVSDESGKNEVYIVSYPSAQTKLQVSSGGRPTPPLDQRRPRAGVCHRRAEAGRSCSESTRERNRSGSGAAVVRESDVAAITRGLVQRRPFAYRLYHAGCQADHSHAAHNALFADTD